MFKKFLPLFIVVFLFSNFACTLSHPSEKKIEFFINSNHAYVNGVKKTLDQGPVIVNQRTLVPLRFIGEEMAATVEWDSNEEKVTMRMDYAPYFKEKLNQWEWSDHVQMGNTMGNLANTGKFVLYNDWVYTTWAIKSKNEEGEWMSGQKIIRMRSDGSNVEELGKFFYADHYDDYFHTYMLNIVDDYLYFLNEWDEGASFPSVSENLNPLKLCKVYIEGGEIEVLLEGYIHSMLVYGEWIYLTISSENETEKGGWNYSHLYRMKTDGSDLELLMPETTFHPTIYRGYLYVTLFYEGEQGIIRMLPDGSNFTIISYRAGAYTQGHEGWIYFIDHTNYVDRPIGSLCWARGNLYKVRPDGTEETLVYEGKVNSLNTSNAWLYFVDSGSIFRLHSINGDLHQLHEDAQSPILLLHDWIYFTEAIKKIEGEWFGGEEFRMRTDGSNKEKIYPLSSEIVPDS